MRGRTVEQTASLARRRALACAFLVMVGGLATPRAGGAQDMEAVARARGIELPRAYYERIARDPTAYTLPNGLFRKTADGRVESIRNISGTHKLLVLPALFSDSDDPHITSEMIDQALFTGPAERGTITEAYAEMSRGALNVTGLVVPWVRTSRPMAEVVGTENGLGEDADMGPYFIEALELADETVDYGEYDNDGPDGVPNSGDDDGYVDVMTFEFLEIAGSCGGPSIWPHRWGISPQNGGEPWTSEDPRPGGGFVRVDAYIVQSVADCTGENVQTANTIAHEYGHALGLPDYYHPVESIGPEGRRWVLGCWELMAAGAWGCGPVGSNREAFGPTHLSARSKNILGWLDFVDLGTDLRNHEVVLDPVQESGEGLRIPLDEAGREFLLLEYRTKEGFDDEIPAEGVLVYHQDLSGSLRPSVGSGTPYFLRLLEQDDDNGLIRTSSEGGDRGVASDAWGVDGADRKLNVETAPNTRRNDGSATPVAIHSLTVQDRQARIVLSTAATPEIVPPESPLEVGQVTTFERRLRVAGGVMPYTALGEVPEGIALSGQGDELVITGSVTGPGPFSLRLQVRDSQGNSSPELSLPLTADEEWSASLELLLQPFLGGGGEPLTPGEQTYMDFLGNRNGFYDVGDLRAWLRSQGG